MTRGTRGEAGRTVEVERRADAPMRVAICVVTYQRPRMLADLLATLGELRFRKVPAPELELVVVDGDPARSAAPIVQAALGRLPGPVHYQIQPERNISLSRNAAVARARVIGADLVAFVDDDERVRPQWLDELMSVMKESAADAVCAPVEPVFERGTPSWVVRGRFFEQRRIPSGQLIDWGQTGNALVRMEALRGDEPFDPAFGLTGAEDTHFFMRLLRSGGRVAWCAEAAAEEVVPTSRARAGWIIRRAFRVGNNYVSCERAVGDGV